MDAKKRKCDPWIVTSLRKRKKRLYRFEITHTHTFQKQTLVIPSKTDESATKKLVVRLSRLNKTQMDGAFWFANKSVDLT